MDYPPKRTDSKVMIRVLIMDDTPEKIEKVKSVLMGRCLLKEEEIEGAQSINSGRKALHLNVYDLLILDLVMPINDGDEVSVDFDSGVITDITTGQSFKGQAFPPFMQNIINAGGLVNYVNDKA